MCVLALVLGDDGRLVAAANRDEAYDRPSAPPAEIEPGVIAPLDLRGGGTWLAVNRHGLFAAVTNRTSPAPGDYSRGLLLRDTLSCRQLNCLRGIVERAVDRRRMAGFNLVAVVGGRGVCLMWDGALRAVEFGPGAHVVSSDRDFDDPALPEKRAFDAFLAQHDPTPERLRSFLASHEGERPVCKHKAGFGTVSSTIVADDGARFRMWHAAGPPCSTPLQPVAT